jgi:hypothetical protein
MTKISDLGQRILALRRMLVYRDTKLGRFRCYSIRHKMVLYVPDIVMSVIIRMCMTLLCLSAVCIHSTNGAKFTGLT